MVDFDIGMPSLGGIGISVQAVERLSSLFSMATRDNYETLRTRATSTINSMMPCDLYLFTDFYLTIFDHSAISNGCKLKVAPANEDESRRRRKNVKNKKRTLLSWG